MREITSVKRSKNVYHLSRSDIEKIGDVLSINFFDDFFDDDLMEFSFKGGYLTVNKASIKKEREVEKK